MVKIRVAVVDDHAIVRQGLVGLLRRDDRVEVTGEADSGRTAVDLVVDTQPDVVLMDVTMPDLDGIAATRQIKERQPETRVIALTMHQDRAHIRQAFEGGVSGYLLKRNDLGDLIAAIEAVMAGDIYLSPGISRVVVQAFLGDRGGVVVGGKSGLISGREHEVLILIAEGRTNREVAALLNISEKTVAAHRANLMQKLGLKNAVGLVRYAIREGLIEL